MSWVINTENDSIHVRAIIDTKAERDQIHELIAALEKRLTKESPTDERPAPSNV